jgi:hypothetical protein
MLRHFLLTLMTTALVAPLAGCATPDEIAANAERRLGTPQTGTSIAKRDHAGRVSGTSDADNNQRTLDDLRNTPSQSAVPRGGGG